MKESSNPLYNSFIKQYEDWYNTIIEIVREPIDKYMENEDILDGIQLKEDFFVKNINKNKKLKTTQSYIEQCSIYDYENKKVFSFNFQFNNTNELDLIKIDIGYDKNKKQNAKIMFFRLEKRNYNILYELDIDSIENSLKLSGSDKERDTDFSLYLNYENQKISGGDFINARTLAKDDLFYEQSNLIKSLADTHPELITDMLFTKKGLNEEIVELFKLSNDVDISSLLKVSFPTDHEYQLTAPKIEETKKNRLIDFIKNKMRIS